MKTFNIIYNTVSIIIYISILILIIGIKKDVRLIQNGMQEIEKGSFSSLVDALEDYQIEIVE